MIKSLYIKDFALIEEVDVHFAPGLNIITGETGAGKSILLGGLQLLMGSRASMDAVRTGASKSIVEGTFDVRASTAVSDLLLAADVDTSDTLIIRREITENHSRAFVNDTPANLTFLKDLADRLVDLHGQHQHQSLLREETHRQLLDRIGGLDDTVGTYQELLHGATQISRKIESLRERRDKLEQQRELSEFQLNEIQAVNPLEGEEDDLQRELDILEHADTLLSTTTGIFEALYEQDGAVIDQLDRMYRELDAVVRYDEQLKGIAGELRTSVIALQEAATTLNDYANSVDLDPERLESVRERLGTFERLKRKYGGSLEAVREHAAEKKAELAAVFNFEQDLGELERQKDEVLTELGDVARTLSEARKHCARDVEKEIIAALAELDIADASFEIRFTVEPDEEGWITVEDGTVASALPTGVDRIEFYISTNPGEAVKPLVEVASGGEVSRVMLALKSILAKAGEIPTMIFDEIDVGISGRTAQQVGLKLRDLSADHQLICITHLPQIAAMAETHFVVEKSTEQGRTRSRIRRLTDDERASNVAVLMSGKNVSEAALKSARELIDSVGEVS